MRFLAAVAIFLPASLFLLIAFLALPVNDFDQQVAQEMKEIGESNEPLRFLMLHITDVGGLGFMCGLAVVGAGWLAWRRQYVVALAWVVIFLGGGLLDMGLKRVFGRDRPPETIRDAAISESNKSFPSGHSMGSMVGYGLVAYVIWLAPWPRARKTMAIVGLALLMACVSLLEWQRRRGVYV